MRSSRWKVGITPRTFLRWHCTTTLQQFLLFLPQNADSFPTSTNISTSTYGDNFIDWSWWNWIIVYGENTSIYSRWVSPEHSRDSLQDEFRAVWWQEVQLEAVCRVSRLPNSVTCCCCLLTARKPPLYSLWSNWTSCGLVFGLQS